MSWHINTNPSIHLPHSNSLINSFLHSSLDLLGHVLHTAARMETQMCKPHIWQCQFFAQRLSMTFHRWSLPFQTPFRSLPFSTLHFNCSELLTVPKGRMCTGFVHSLLHVQMSFPNFLKPDNAIFPLAQMTCTQWNLTEPIRQNYH